MPKSKKASAMRKDLLTVFIYYDGDHGDSAVFSTLEKAKAYAEKAWDNDYDEWEECDDTGLNWKRGEYQFVWGRTIDEDSN